MKQENKLLLVGLLGMLRGAKWMYWNSHWMSQGEPYYGDHLMFQRLYEGDIDNQIDTLAEKIVAYDKDILTENIMQDAFNGFLNKHLNEKNIFKRGYNVEEHLQNAIKNTYDKLKSSDDLSLGMDDYLMATANARETVMYLLKQRIR